MPPVNTDKVQQIRWEVDTKKLDAYAKHVNKTAPQVVRALAFEIQGRAAQNAPVDTGALRNSIYVRTYDADPFPGISTDAKRVRLPRPGNDKHAVIGPSVEYGLYVEMGTQRMGAQPYLAPAVASVRQQFEREIRKVFNKKV